MTVRKRFDSSSPVRLDGAKRGELPFVAPCRRPVPRALSRLDWRFRPRSPRSPHPMTTAFARVALKSRPWLAAVLACVCAGCASIDRAMLGVDDESTRIATFEQRPEPQGPMERFLVASGLKKEEKSPYKQVTLPPEAHQAYEEAEKLFDAKKYAQAEDAADAIAKEYRNSILEEDALFLEGKSQFHRKRYAAAQDTYAELFERFPSTRYMDTATGHLFEISRYWLQFPKIVESSDIQPANFEAPSTSPLPKPEERPFDITRAVPFLPNVFDPTRPLFDTEGRALAALKAIWLNDPTGSLADDALMLTASHYLREGNYLEADHYYEILREEYPKSPHLQDAFVIGGHAKLMSYQGAVYDKTALAEAERLKESTLRLFPEGPQRERIKGELEKIDNLEEERAWALIEFYQRKGARRLPAVAMSCYMLLLEHPESKYASRAREILAKLPKEATENVPPLPARTTPPSSEPDLKPVPGSYE